MFIAIFDAGDNSFLSLINILQQRIAKWQKDNHYKSIPVSNYLVNGIKLQGQIESFDQFVILLKNTVNQMVYKHAISTVVPARSVSHHNNNGGHHAAQTSDAVAEVETQAE